MNGNGTDSPRTGVSAPGGTPGHSGHQSRADGPVTPRPRAFLVRMSSGDPIRADESDLPQILRAIAEGRSTRLRQAVFNPSFYVAVVEDTERVSHFLSDLQDTQRYNRTAVQVGNKPRELPQWKELPDVFAGLGLPEAVAPRREPGLQVGAGAKPAIIAPRGI